MIRLAIANICSAFDNQTIGTKVKPEKREQVIELLESIIPAHEFPESGQLVISCPELIPLVLSGDAPKTNNVEDYVLRLYRGEVNKFLNRERVGNVEIKKCSAVVYTRGAYLADPDVGLDGAEQDRIKKLDCTHVLVASLAGGGSRSAVSPYRFVMNLAGGNNDYSNLSGEQIRCLAHEIKQDIQNEWCTVSD